jgi:1-acyl-sn-glycerol-3-phosphate acyltransferase
MKILLKPFQVIYTIYALLLFVIIMFIAVPLVVVSLFFGRISGGNFLYKVFKAWGHVWYFLIGVRHKNIYEVPHDTSRQYIFTANHISYMDIPPIVLAIHQPVRVLAKYEMSKIPVFGFIYKKATIMVDRRDADKRAQSIKEMKSFLQHHVSIFIFPEGTFNETGAPLKDFYDGAFRVAIETETAIKPILFVDSIDRLDHKSIFTLTPGKNRVVFLAEVPVAGLTIDDMPVLKQKVYNIMDEGLRRYRTYPANS